MKLDCEDTLRRKFSTSETNRQVYTETVEITVPAATKLKVIFIWKNLCQCGYIDVCTPENGVAQIPFKIVVGVTFDQSQVDEST
jgi:hypothetical protein